jgi:glycosyltransferase involved in cell wall biosynthesis
MRILAITAGAGGMYCGSCVRDNALAAEMIARGHAVSLLPIYTTTLTDETNVSDGPVLFGGISVYLQQHVPLMRRTPAILDKIWDSAPVIRAFASRSSAVDPKFLGELTVSTLRGEDGFQAKEVGKLVDWLKQQQRFDVVVLPNSMLIGLAAPIRRAVGGPILCTLQGEDLFLEGLDEPYKSQSLELIRGQVAEVDAFVAVSRYYGEFMGKYLGIPPDKIDVVPLGITLEGHADARPPRDGPFTIGYFARIAPEKSLDILVEAYRILRRDKGLPPSRLEAAGYMADEHKPYLAQIEARLEEYGLRGEFRYHGTVDRASKIRFLQNLDVLSVPSRYVEPKGLYLLEAMANGVPVVQPRHGAFLEMIEATGGGLLFEPGNPEALAETLLSLWRDPDLRHAMGHRGALSVGRHYGASQMAERAIEVYRRRAAAATPAAAASPTPSPAESGSFTRPRDLPNGSRSRSDGLHE